MRCAACGKESAEGIFCSECGAVLSATISPKPLPPEPPKAAIPLPMPDADSRPRDISLPSGRLVLFLLLILSVVVGIAIGMACNRPVKRPPSVVGSWRMTAMQDREAVDARYAFRADGTGQLTQSGAEPIEFSYQFNPDSHLLTITYTSAEFADRTDIWYAERSGKELILYTWYPEDQAHGMEYCRFETISEKGTASQAVTGTST